MQVYLMGGGGGLKGGGLSMLGRKHCSFTAENVRGDACMHDIFLEANRESERGMLLWLSQFFFPGITCLLVLLVSLMNIFVIFYNF